MESTIITADEFLKAAREFVKISDRLCDGWKICENNVDIHKLYIRKETFIFHDENLVKAEYIIFYNQSYRVPSFSFNMWNSLGVLLTLENIRDMSSIRIKPEDFYSVITQQEHPILFRPYFIMHPCQTESLLTMFKKQSKNIIVTFLSLITPLIRLNLPLEYGFCDTEEAKCLSNLIVNN